MLLPSRTEVINLGSIRYNVRHWGDPGSPKLFLLHGRMDSSPTFQFVVDAFERPWHVIAPDWRGYGASEWLARPYWYHDYYADLDRLLDHYSPDQPARLVGHSMGANIAAIYAAARPERVFQLAMLDFLGLPRPTAGAAEELRKWLEAIAEGPQLRPFASVAAFAQRMQKLNPRLTLPRAEFLARATSRPRSDGQVERTCDPWHNVPSPNVYRVEEAMETWRHVVAPVLLLIAEDGYIRQRFADDRAELERRVACFADRQVAVVADSGHNLQHDQPEVVAAELEKFLGRD